MTDFKETLKKIATLRETKGKEQEAFALIAELLPKAQQENDYKTIATLYWELHLLWQHFVMTERAKPKDAQNETTIKNSIEKMGEFAQKALNIIETHKITNMLGGAYRFLGRAATFANDHQKAKECYEKAILNYEGKNLKSKLEVSGFLAEALVRLGKPVDGLQLAIKTYEDFHNSPLGIELKNSDYFTWAVWMSGIAPRTCMALMDTGSAFDKTHMKDWLEKTKHELQNPSGKITWGDNKFEFRINEIDAALARV